jgi:hypothetical protein
VTYDNLLIGNWSVYYLQPELIPDMVAMVCEVLLKIQDEIELQQRMGVLTKYNN